MVNEGPALVHDAKATGCPNLIVRHVLVIDLQNGEVLHALCRRAYERLPDVAKADCVGEATWPFTIEGRFDPFDDELQRAFELLACRVRGLF